MLRALVCMLAFLAPAAWASGWGAVLNDAAITDFNDDDLREYLATVHALLAAPQPAAPVDWSNPKTGAGAHLEMIGQPQIAGFNECRRVRTNVYSRKHKAETRTWTACRDTDGGWRLVKGK